MTDLKTNMANTVVAVQDTQKKISEPPTAIHVKGITITPGGFLAAEFVRRSRALGADVNTPLNSLTMPGASQSSMSEFFGSGRQSRVSMLAEGKLELRQAVRLRRSRLPFRRHHLEQQPEQQLHHATAPGLWPGCL